MGPRNGIAYASDYYASHRNEMLAYSRRVYWEKGRAKAIELKIAKQLERYRLLHMPVDELLTEMGFYDTPEVKQ